MTTVQSSSRLLTRRRGGGRPVRRGSTGLMFVMPAVLLVVLLFVVPTVMTAWMSLHDWPLIGTQHFVGLDNYDRIVHDPGFWRALRFTSFYTLVVTLVLFVVGFALASLVRHQRRGVGIFRTIFVMPVVLGFATASYLTLWLLDTRIGIVDKVLTDSNLVSAPIEWLGGRGLALTAVVVMVVWKTVGLTMLLLMGGMQAISNDYYEAASLDGASAWRQFRSITVPLLRPTIALVLILTVIGSYLAFDQFFILTQGGPDSSTVTLVYLIYRSAFIDFNLGYSSALSVVLMVVLLLLTVAQFRILRQEDL